MYLHFLISTLNSLKNHIRLTFKFCICLLSCSITSKAQDFNYAEVLQKSLYFYECQRSGILPINNRVSWRGNSALSDGKDHGVDLTGGWYDAGDHIKFGFPMANAATKLAWSGIESKDAYQSIGQWSKLLENLRWVNDYFIKCIIKNKKGEVVKFFGQVGKGNLDHPYWGSAELMTMKRPSYFVDAKHPGTDLTAETAAAMAAASIVFKEIDSVYSNQLIIEAKALYQFAEKYRGKYTSTITDAKKYYESFSGYTDELVWGAIWLYKATHQSIYLAKAKKTYIALPDNKHKAYIGGDSWDNKAFASYVLMATLTNETKYKRDAERYFSYWTTGYEGQKITYSPGGQAFLYKWGSLRFAANTAFLALTYANHIKHNQPLLGKKYTQFAIGQINYMLGKNPAKRSYVVGFGNNWPTLPHHRNAHGSLTNNIRKPLKNKNILYGALVGGPSKPNDTYTDSRLSFIENEVSCDYNAGFTGAIAYLVSIYGGEIIQNFPFNEYP